MALLLCGACGGEAEDAVAVADPRSGDAAITAVSWDCDPDLAQWSFVVDTEHWTAGGVVWITGDTDRAERHGLPSVAAAEDGSTDHLELKLSVVSDWRYAVLGSSTGWRCLDEPELSFVVVIYAEDDSGETDCRSWGANPEIWAEIPGGPVCGTALEVVEDTGTGG